MFNIFYHIKTLYVKVYKSLGSVKLRDCFVVPLALLAMTGGRCGLLAMTIGEAAPFWELSLRGARFVRPVAICGPQVLSLQGPTSFLCHCETSLPFFVIGRLRRGRSNLSFTPPNTPWARRLPRQGKKRPSSQ